MASHLTSSNHGSGPSSHGPGSTVRPLAVSGRRSVASKVWLSIGSARGKRPRTGVRSAFRRARFNRRSNASPLFLQASCGTICSVSFRKVMRMSRHAKYEAPRSSAASADGDRGRACRSRARRASDGARCFPCHRITVPVQTGRDASEFFSRDPLAAHRLRRSGPCLPPETFTAHLLAFRGPEGHTR